MENNGPKNEPLQTTVDIDPVWRLGRRHTWRHKWSTCQQSSPSNIMNHQ